MSPCTGFIRPAIQIFSHLQWDSLWCPKSPLLHSIFFKLNSVRNHAHILTIHFWLLQVKYFTRDDWLRTEHPGLKIRQRQIFFFWPQCIALSFITLIIWCYLKLHSALLFAIHKYKNDIESCSLTTYNALFRLITYYCSLSDNKTPVSGAARSKT